MPPRNTRGGRASYPVPGWGLKSPAIQPGAGPTTHLNPKENALSTIDTDPMARYRDFHRMYDLDDMRSTLAKVTDLPGETSIHLFLNDGNEQDSYAPATELQVTYWDGYERCAADDEHAKLSLFFIYPAEHPDGVAGEGDYHPISTLAELREAIARLDGLPGDTSVSTFEDCDDEDPFVFAELQVAWWNGEIQCEEHDESASRALFVIPS